MQFLAVTSPCNKFHFFRTRFLSNPTESLTFTRNSDSSLLKKTSCNTFDILVKKYDKRNCFHPFEKKRVRYTRNYFMA